MVLQQGKKEGEAKGYWFSCCDFSLLHILDVCMYVCMYVCVIHHGNGIYKLKQLKRMKYSNKD